MTSTIARVTVFYLSQYFMVPTRVASWAFRFCKFYSFIYCMPCRYTLVSQNSLLIFNKRIYTLYIVVLVIYSLIWQTTMHLHPIQVICTCSALPGMAHVTVLE